MNDFIKQLFGNSLFKYQRKDQVNKIAKKFFLDYEFSSA